MDDAAARRLDQRAILCVLASSACFAVAGALVKAVASTIPTFEIMLFRSAFALFALLPLMRSTGLGAFRTRNPVGHAVRIAAGGAGMCGSVYGYAHLPLAMVTALGFAMPSSSCNRSSSSQSHFFCFLGGGGA